MKSPCLLLLVVFAPFAFAAERQLSPTRVEVSRDLWISSYEKEREGNNGASPKLKLKGIQEFFLIDFDPVPLRGKRVVRAELHVHPEGAESLGRTTVSSIAEEWVEGTGTGYARVPGASCFAWARTDQQRWRDVDITGSINGAGGSLWGFGDPTPRDSDGWQVIPVAPEVVQARLDGGSYGFCVMDDVGNEYTRHGETIEYRQFPNRFLTSREGSRKTAPYFVLWLDDHPPLLAPHPAPPPNSRDVAKLPELSAPPKGPQHASPFAAHDEFGEPLASLDFSAARNEAIAFYLETPSAGSVVEEGGGLPVSLFSVRKVEGRFDPLVPAGWKAAPDSEDAGTYVEIFVPRDASQGSHEITLNVAGKHVRFAVQVWNFTLPDQLSFIPQMNCYGLPGHERDYYRLAHDHRATLNHLLYGWTGKVKAAPKIAADGQWDWRAWDAEYGPLFDGSAFAGTPRGPIPVEAFYLPLNENWPMDEEGHFRGGYWIENAYDDAYWSQFRHAAAQFAQHFAEKKWTEPVFEFYLNNKVYFKRDRGNRWDACSAPWIFDEPVNTQDFWALRKFGTEFWRGVAANPGAHFAFRADISRPEWQRDLLDGVTNTEVVSGVLRTYRDRVIGRARRLGNQVYMYGSANRIGTANIVPAAWCVETWALGADGVVPWQTIGQESAWTKADELSLFYPTADGPIPSLRLKSFRAGEQLVEYLTLYCALAGEDRDAVGAAVLAEPGMHAVLKKQSEADAGDSLFGPEAHHTFVDLRQRLGAWLDAKAPAPRDRWHDPRPTPQNPNNVRKIAPLPAPQ
ncbi:hypothetical protein CfE428DRAFT_4969 [Chthoniobacter flavus Ellin428]|uniref:Uncharacterized protein n=1 Tax=Chthoniobacter flavus Ellin428 TaxID=497964 RepID=B4D7S9_9BACT|nr:glycoside hydrolase domain-containing protein [Chthoniobacter flavus]EDY17452.1 hypothetical protein CfE428DRAFT_4969 [Chthoniobacter flavus Ellin428]TCO92251.1 uncharacterized protein DUF4091 [Chthoniobacter flavus]